MPYTTRQIKRLDDNRLITTEQVPHTALRVSEVYLKRKMFVVEDQAVRAQAQLYRQAYRNIRNAANDFDERGVTGRQWRLSLVSVIREQTREANRQAAGIALQASAVAAAGAYYGKLWQLDTATKPDVNVRLDRSFNPLNTALNIKEAYNGVGYTQILDTAAGSAFAEQFTWLADELTPQIAQALITGMDAGESIPKLMRRVADKMGITLSKKPGFKANFHKIQTLTRTVVNQVSNEAAHAIFQANADLLNGWQWLTAQDERVCPLCAPLDGVLFTVNSSYRPPRHPNCRCTEIPAINPAALLPPDVVPSMTFDEWLSAFGIASQLINEFLSSNTLESDRV